jgi:hypothetical protein
MIPSLQKHRPASRDFDPNRSFRLPFLVGVIAVSLATGGALLRLFPRAVAPAAPFESASMPSRSKSESAPPLDALKQQTLQESHAPNQSPDVAIQAPAPVPVQIQQPSEQTRQLVNALVQPGMALTQEQAGQWKQSLEQLIQEGAAAVPAMREFLARNVDLDFGPGGTHMFGYPSVRAAMIDALQQIGGPDAMSLMLQTMQTTTDPREIALLAQSLEQQAPEQYRQEAINATRETLAMASQGKLDGRDVGPLFEVLQKLGGPAVVSDLEHAAGNWNYYAALSLAQLPDGTGIPALIQMAGEPGKGSTSVALEMLARVATQYPEAESALLDLTRQNKIPPKLWPYLASALAGEQYRYLDSVFGGTTPTPGAGNLTTIHINFGNQNLYSAGASRLSPDQINRQVSLIDQLLSAANDPAAAALLQRSRDRLLERLPQTAAATSPAQQ